MTPYYLQTLLHHCVEQSAFRNPDSLALVQRDQSMRYRQLWREIDELANALIHSGLSKHDRVAIYLPKQFETVIAMFACSCAGLIFVPINPVLKRQQVTHILQDSGATILVTTRSRLRALLPIAADGLRQIIVCDHLDGDAEPDWIHQLAIKVTPWQALTRDAIARHPIIDSDPVAIFYTSGSTGLAKGVLVSHRNLVSGANSIVSYLKNHKDDRLLALLPLSFDYGFSQLSSAMLVGARLVLMEYLLPKDVMTVLKKQAITGLAAVPSLWSQLAAQSFGNGVGDARRDITNSGGSLPLPVLRSLRAQLPDCQVFLMYGLTEAFRSTFLDPALVDQYPNSIGTPIPNADILLLRSDGSECDIDEEGELVHRGSLVALGYWNNPALSARRFKPLPSSLTRQPQGELAVYSGDWVKKDRNGLMYFVSRRDEMIKTSGYRVSPNEIELLLTDAFPQYAFAAFAIGDDELGQAIVLAIAGVPDIVAAVAAKCRELFPTYMQPRHFIQMPVLPLNSNNKIDRGRLSREFQASQQGSNA